MPEGEGVGEDRVRRRKFRGSAKARAKRKMIEKFSSYIFQKQNCSTRLCVVQRLSNQQYFEIPQNYPALSGARLFCQTGLEALLLSSFRLGPS